MKWNARWFVFAKSYSCHHTWISMAEVTMSAKTFDFGSGLTKHSLYSTRLRSIHLLLFTDPAACKTFFKSIAQKLKMIRAIWIWFIFISPIVYCSLAAHNFVQFLIKSIRLLAITWRSNRRTPKTWVLDTEMGNIFAHTNNRWNRKQRRNKIPIELSQPAEDDVQQKKRNTQFFFLPFDEIPQSVTETTVCYMFFLNVFLDRVYRVCALTTTVLRCHRSHRCLTVCVWCVYLYIVIPVSMHRFIRVCCSLCVQWTVAFDLALWPLFHHTFFDHTFEPKQQQKTVMLFRLFEFLWLAVPLILLVLSVRVIVCVCWCALLIQHVGQVT